MQIQQNRRTLKTLEIVSTVITILITAIPALMLAVLMIDAIKTEFDAIRIQGTRDWVNAAQIIGFTSIGIFGFICLICRLNNIALKKTSKIVAIGLIVGTLFFTLAYGAEAPRLLKRGYYLYLVAIFFPVFSTSVSLRNIYWELKNKKQEH